MEAWIGIFSAIAMSYSLLRVCTASGLSTSQQLPIGIMYKQKRRAGGDINLHQHLVRAGRDNEGGMARRMAGAGDRGDAGRQFLACLVLGDLAPERVENPANILEISFEEGDPAPLLISPSSIQKFHSAAAP